MAVYAPIRILCSFDHDRVSPIRKTWLVPFRKRRKQSREGPRPRPDAPRKRIGLRLGKGVCNYVTALLQLAICCCSALILISTALVLARHPFPLNHKTPSSFRTTGDARVDCEDQRRRYTSCYVVCAAPSTGRSLKASSHYDVGEGVRYCKIGDGKCPPRHPRKASPALDEPRDDL